MRFLLFIVFSISLLFLQKTELGPDDYLNKRAAYMCKQIAQSKTPIENMNWKQAHILTSKRGLEAANESVEHVIEFEKKGVRDGVDHIYSGYVDLYLFQACQDYSRFFSVFNLKYLDNKLQRQRFIEVHNFVSDLMQTNQIDNMQDYLESDETDTIINNLFPHINGLQKIRWTSSLLVYSPSRIPNKFVARVIDIYDTRHIYEFEIIYTKERDSKINEFRINEYTKSHPKIENIETLDIVPDTKH